MPRLSLPAVIAVIILLPTAAARADTSVPIERPPDGGGEFLVDTRVPCLSDAERERIQLEIARNVADLQARGVLAPPNPDTTVLFDWPLRPAPRLDDPGYHGISNFVDHDPLFPDSRLDYECGQRTYDLPGYNHQGTDYFLWPFSWSKMDRNEVAIVSAAPGMIVYKHDGESDRSCGFGGSWNQWNAVYVQHADGSTLLYGHMKNGSLTAKGVGETVAAGEYLGIVGSSGFSTGPHLHLELYDGGGALNDPYDGPCNDMNPFSWWSDQRDYYDSSVNKIATHDAPPFFPPCPQVETPNYQDFFEAGDIGHFAAYYRDQLRGLVSTFTIYEPDDTIFRTWTFSIPHDHYAASYFYWLFNLPSTLGTWRFEVDFDGGLYKHTFSVGPTFTTGGSCPGGVSLDISGATPGGTLALLRGQAEGESAVPAGACAGTKLGLDQPKLLRQVRADDSGRVSVMVQAPEGACDLLLQVVDVSTCGVSPVRTMP